MKRHTQSILYHLLPVVIWLLAIGGAVVPLLPFCALELSPISYLIPVAVVFFATFLLTSLKRHASSVETCFIVAVLLGAASYWLPTILFLAIPACIYLQMRNLLTLRSVTAFLLGYALVAIWMTVLVFLSIFNYQFSFTENAYGWIPIGAVLLAWTAATIVRRNLRVR